MVNEQTFQRKKEEISEKHRMFNEPGEALFV